MEQTWYDYRNVWAGHPGVLALAIVGGLLTLLGIIGTVLSDLLALLFLPGLGVLFAHHLLVRRRLG